MASEPQFIRCSACGANNRVSREKLQQGRQPVCGRCKAELVPDHGPLTVSDTTFSDQVERSPLPVLVDLWAPWCGPCHMMTPIVEELAKQFAGRVRVAKMNIDENPATAARFRIESIPTLLVFQAGREVDRIVGVQPKSEILRRLERVTL